MAVRVELTSFLTRWDLREGDPAGLGAYCLTGQRSKVGPEARKQFWMWQGPATSRLRVASLGIMGSGDPLPVNFEVYSADDMGEFPLIVAAGSWTPAGRGENRTLLQVSGILTPMWAVAMWSEWGDCNVALRAWVDRLDGAGWSAVAGQDVTLTVPAP